jgi:hypothetical protein
MNNSEIFDIFDNDNNVNHDDGFSDHGNVGSQNSKAITMLIVGVILLSVVVVIDGCVRCYMICKIRKQKRTVVPSPDDVLAAAGIATGGADNRNRDRGRRIQPDEDP